jgi:hypothetical protein
MELLKDFVRLVFGISPVNAERVAMVLLIVTVAALIFIIVSKLY